MFRIYFQAILDRDHQLRDDPILFLFALMHIGSSMKKYIDQNISCPLDFEEKNSIDYGEKFQLDTYSDFERSSHF